MHDEALRFGGRCRHVAVGMAGNDHAPRRALRAQVDQLARQRPRLDGRRSSRFAQVARDRVRYEDVSAWALFLS